MAVNETTIAGGVTGRSAWDSLLKTVYGPLWQLHAYIKVVVTSQIMNPKGRMGGKAILSAIIDSLPQSAGIALFEYDDLPTARTLTALRPEMHTKDLYTRLQITGNVMRAAAAGDQNAWAQPMAQQLKLSRDQFMLNLARMMYLSEGQLLGKVQSAYEADGAETVTLFGRNARLSSVTAMHNFGVHYMRRNQSIWFTAANAPLGDPQPTAVERYIRSTPDGSNVAAPRIVLDADPAGGTVVANGYAYPWGSRRLPGTNNGASVVESEFAGPNGLFKLVGDSALYPTIYTQTRSSYPTLSGIRSTNGGAPQVFSEMLIGLGIDRISDDGVGSEPDVLMLHRSTRREVVKELRGQRMFPVIQTESGFGKLTYSAGDTIVPYIVDRDCPPGLVFLLDTEHFGWLTNSNMGPLETGDRRFIANKDAVELNMHMSGNEFNVLPAGSGTVEDFSYLTNALTA